MATINNSAAKGIPIAIGIKKIYNGLTFDDVLQQQQNIHIDELYFKSGLSSSAVATALLMLEMQGVVASLPGKVYKLL